MRHLLLALTVLAILVAGCNSPAAGGETWQPAWGCFAERGRLKCPTSWEQHCRLMAWCGMNSAAIYPVNEADLVDQVEAGLRAGLFRADVPIVLVSNMNDAPGTTNEESWLLLPGRVARAKSTAPHRNQWPEIFLYGTDEPVRVEQAMVWSCNYRGGGARALTSLCYENAGEFAPYLDGAFIHTSPGVLTARNVQAFKDAGSWWGIYNIGLRRASRELMRYYAGRWYYQTGARWLYMWDWAWMIHDYPTGPLLMSKMAGYKQGVADYRKLARLKADLGPPDWNFWPGMVDGTPEVRAAWKRDWIRYAGKCKVPEVPACLQ